MLRKQLHAVAGLVACWISFTVAGCSSSDEPGGRSGPREPGVASADRFTITYSSRGMLADAQSAAVEVAESPKTLGDASLERKEPPRGRIIGVVKWVGTPPPPERVQVPQDHHVCAEHGRHDRLSEALVVNPTSGGVKDAVVHLVGNFNDSETPLLEETQPPVLNQRECSYEPRVFVLPVGTKLAMTSDDDVGHNIRMQGAAELNIAISKGGRATRRLERVGLVRVGCDIHPWMMGYIHVVRHPHYAVSNSDGQFELPAVPAGEHTIRLWHEAWWREDGKLANPVESTHTVEVRDDETTVVVFEFSSPGTTGPANSAHAAENFSRR